MPPMRPCAGSPAEADADTMNFARQQKQIETAEALAPGASPIDAAETEAPKGGLRGRYAWLGTIASLAILAGSLFVLDTLACDEVDAAQRLGGQLRVLPGAVIGWDMSAALALGDALGVPPLAMAELLPVIEAVMVAKLNEQMERPNG